MDLIQNYENADRNQLLIWSREYSGMKCDKALETTKEDHGIRPPVCVARVIRAQLHLKNTTAVLKVTSAGEKDMKMIYQNVDSFETCVTSKKKLPL